MPDDVVLRCEFEKAAGDGSYIRGWANVSSINGEDVTDDEGDVIALADLRKGAHDFIMNCRVAKALHEGQQIGDIVESVIIDDAFAEAHGITHGKRGWWIGVAVNDSAVRKMIVGGTFKAFSIGGTGERTAIGG